MTNEELDRARAKEAAKRVKQLGVYNGSLPVYSISAITEAARLAREGWTPPKVVDPDLAEAEKVRQFAGDCQECGISGPLAGIKRGRELERAEAKPGMVWVKHDGGKCPVSERTWVWAEPYHGSPQQACDLMWSRVTHYAIITSPEGK